MTPRPSNFQLHDTRTFVALLNYHLPPNSRLRSSIPPFPVTLNQVTHITSEALATAAGRSITRSKRLRSGIMASMEAKDIEERGKQLAKAAVGGDPPATLLALLDGLKGWTATEKLLRQTKIGVHVNKLRQNPDTQVARTATTLVNKWKGDVKKAPATAASSGTNSPAPNKSSPAPAAASKLKAEPQGDLEKRNSLSDKIDTAVTGNQTRDACIKLMYDGLAFMSPDGMR